VLVRRTLELRRVRDDGPQVSGASFHKRQPIGPTQHGDHAVARCRDETHGAKRGRVHVRWSTMGSHLSRGCLASVAALSVMFTVACSSKSQLSNGKDCSDDDECSSDCCVMGNGWQQCRSASSVSRCAGKSTSSSKDDDSDDSSSDGSSSGGSSSGSGSSSGGSGSSCAAYRDNGITEAQSKAYCRMAHGYKCAGNTSAVKATCETFRKFASAGGSASYVSKCPYC